MYLKGKQHRYFFFINYNIPLVSTQLWLFIMFIVPAPLIIVEVPDTKIVGQSLTLNCSVTTVRGITSRLDIVWSSNGTELQKTEGVMVKSISHTSMLFIDFYTISKVSTTDEGRNLQCEVKINRNATVTVTESITLHVTGKCPSVYTSSIIYWIYFLFKMPQFLISTSPSYHLVLYKEL